MMNHILLRPSLVGRSLGLVALALVVASTVGKLAAHLIPNPYVRRAASMFDVDTEGELSNRLFRTAAAVRSVASRHHHPT